MGYKVLALKWRPQSFDQIIGQDHITQALSNAIKFDRYGGPNGSQNGTETLPKCIVFSDNFPIVEKVTKSGPKDHSEGGSDHEREHTYNGISFFS